MNDDKAIISIHDFKHYEQCKKQIEAIRTSSQLIIMTSMDVYYNRNEYQIINADEAIKALIEDIELRKKENNKQWNKNREFGTLISNLKRNVLFRLFFYSYFKKYDPWND